jgi:hypothetical protein
VSGLDDLDQMARGEAREESTKVTRIGAARRVPELLDH